VPFEIRDSIPPRPATIDEIVEGDLEDVKRLDLKSRSLEALPDDIGRLGNLEILVLDDNRLAGLPDGIRSLGNLRSLFLSHNRIETWRDEWSPPQLAALTLNGNPLRQLPSSLAALPLSILGLPWGDGAEQLVAALPRLAWLIISDCPGPDLPQEVRNLCRLKYLAISGGGVTAPTIPPSWRKTLHTLNFSNIRLASLDFLRPLTSLEFLCIDACSLDVLPEWIGDLKRLNSVTLSGNNLTRLPASLARLPKLLSVDVTGNPLREPLATIAGHGVKPLQAYLRSLEDRAVTLHQAKLVLVGEGKVGKSTLAAVLRGEPFVENRDTTHGIELGTLMLPHPDEPGIDLTLNTWDFGGQDVYRITHQFFYSSQALTLLLWNPRLGVEEGAVVGWLKRLRLRLGAESRVIVVATHADDGRAPVIDWPALQKEFGAMLVAHVAVDSKSGNGLAELRRLIATAAAGLRQMGGEWPESWIAVRDALAGWRKSTPFLPVGEFDRLCAEYGVGDEQQRRVLAWLLHEMGHIIHFADDAALKDVMILDAEWASKAISRVLEDQPTIADGGILHHDRLADIWGRPGKDSPGFDRCHHSFFLRLMERFDATYRIAESEPPCSLVAQKLPTARPDALPWAAEDAPPAGTRVLRMVCAMDDEAPGLMPWLIVRTHRFTTGRHWRSGACLAYPQHRSEALLELNLDKTLALTVRAPHPDYFFTLLHDGLTTLMRERWPGLKPRFMIPCPHEENGRRCDGWFDMDDVLRYRDKGRATIECRKCLAPQNVAALLTGFADDSVPTRLERIEAKLDNISARADLLRRMLRGLGDEARDCPPLFTLVPKDRAAWNPRRMVDIAYTLTLWCTDPDDAHPVADAAYTITPPREWFAAAAPALGFTLKALRLLVPIGDAAALTQMDAAAIASVKEDLGLMDRIATALPTQVDVESATIHGAGMPIRAEGATLRWLAATLRERDPKGGFGGLRRVTDKASGDTHWVCERHLAAYGQGAFEL